MCPNRATRDDPTLATSAAHDDGGLSLLDAVTDRAAQRYRPGERIGRGGMGEVRLCTDTLLERTVARKVLLQRTSLRSFLEEARTQARLEHPSIVPVYDFGIEGDRPYFTMRQISGTTLERTLARRRDDPSAPQPSRTQRIADFLQICRTVAFAHSRGVVHRDLKPANVMLGEFGEIHVLDWGIASSPTRRPGVSVVGDEDHDEEIGCGTLGYAAPEQITGIGEPDGRADIYSLGVLLFELLTAARLHIGATDTDLMASNLAEVDVQQRLDQLPIDLPPELVAVIQRATRREPESRYASVAELTEAVQAFLDGDRDHERREAMADRLLLAAERGGAESGSLEARRELLAAAGRALALVPEHSAALAVLRRLLDAPPSVLPPEVDRRLRLADIEETRKQASSALVSIIGWAALLVVIAMMGIRAPLGFAILSAAVLALFGLGIQRAFWGGRTKTPALIGAAIASVALTLSATLFGPFLVVPVVATASITVFTIDSRPGRALLLLFFLTPILGPWAAERLGWLDATMVVDGVITILPHMAEFSPGATHWTLLIASMAGVVLAHRTVGRGRRLLMDARRQVAVQAWQLEQIVPGVAGDVPSNTEVAARGLRRD
jgi:hypothetical protein